MRHRIPGGQLTDCFRSQSGREAKNCRRYLEATSRPPAVDSRSVIDRPEETLKCPDIGTPRWGAAEVLLRWPWLHARARTTGLQNVSAVNSRGMSAALSGVTEAISGDLIKKGTQALHAGPGHDAFLLELRFWQVTAGVLDDARAQSRAEGALRRNTDPKSIDSASSQLISDTSSDLIHRTRAHRRWSWPPSGIRPESLFIRRFILLIRLRSILKPPSTCSTWP
jgi:hypothetical protein